MLRNWLVLGVSVAALLAGACGSKTSSGNPAVCGNDVLEAGEECEAGDLGGATCAALGLDDGDLACESDCTFDVAQCTGAAVCGDSVRQYPEQCDASDLAGAACTDFGFDGGELDCDGNCQLDTSGCTGTPPCGDDLVAPTEQCDGVNLSGQTCESLGMGTGTLACDETCQFDTDDCSAAPTCGDNVAEATEACDGSDLQSSTCVDAGFDGGELACENDCTFDVSRCWVDTLCGNDILDAGEDCDGSELDGENCRSQGFAGGTLDCNNACMFDTGGCLTEVCGNDVMEGSEACDGTDFGTTTCVTLGHDGGRLGCTNACVIDESQCLDCTTSDTDPPVASNHLPAPDTQGYPASGALGLDLSDACGIDVSTLVMTLTITPRNGPVQTRTVTPVVTGSGTNVSLSFTPPNPLPSGAIVQITVTVDDVNSNTLTEVWRYSIVHTITLFSGGMGGMATMNQLDETNPDANIFTGESFLAGGAAPDRQRLLIRFTNNIPAGALVLDAVLYLARCPGAFAPTTIECYGMRTSSAAHNSTWNLRLEGPPGPSSPWNALGADGVPADHTGTLGASVPLTNTAQLYVWETGPALTLATEWAAGNGTEQQGMLCLNTDPTASNICSPFSNGPPQIEVTYGPALP